jgi:hypothetical protein
MLGVNIEHRHDASPPYGVVTNEKPWEFIREIGT